MNLNVKLEGEEEQTMQYNRLAINIPSGEATFNLNFMNSSLNNQGYIINPINSMGQNIVTYQPSVALQSFIAFPSESENNIIHNLPVGVTLPVSVPLQSGFLQNHNFVNTSIIIENEDCNTEKISKSSPNLLVPEEITETSNFIPAANDERLNCLSQINSENLSKKLCPLEMSIKAANIDLEFEKCEQNVPIIIDSRNLTVGESKVIASNLSTIENHENVKVPLKTLVQSESISEDCNLKKPKTEITWDNNNGKESIVVNNFQESLICEVEEVNEEDEAGGESVDSENEKNNKRNRDTGATSSSEESDGLPLSVALRRDKSKSSKCREVSVIAKKKQQKRQCSTHKSSHQNKKRKKQSENLKGDNDETNDDEEDSDGEEWSESDDDVLNLKRIKNEFNYKCFYEPKTVKSSNSLIMKLEDKAKKFVRVRSCCMKEGCGKKISVKDQSSVYKFYNDLESLEEKNAYLLSCIEYVQMPQNVMEKRAKKKDDNFFSKLEEKRNLALANIKMEIENESNGNPKLSDEIQNAIEESLKDCIVNDSKEISRRHSEGEDKRNSCVEEKNNWNYYIIFENCKKKVCMQFLMKLLRVTKTKIKQLQRKIQSGTALPEEINIVKRNQKSSKVWKVAKLHLNSINCQEYSYCKRRPRHQFSTENLSREDLFENFKKFYYSQNKKELSLKYPSYKKFLEKETSLSFIPKRDGVCSACEYFEEKNQRKAFKKEKLKLKNNNKVKRKKNSSEHYSSNGCDGDNEPLGKRKALKLRIPLKGFSNATKTSHSVGKQNSKNSCGDSKKIKTKAHKEKNKQSLNKGRDVWSLMLLHLETKPYKEFHKCVSKKKHRFFDSSFTIQGLFEDYKKYFLKETNSALGLVFPMYEKYFNRNCNYTIMDVDVDSSKCPRCIVDEAKS